MWHGCEGDRSSAQRACRRVHTFESVSRGRLESFVDGACCTAARGARPPGSASTSLAFGMVAMRTSFVW